MNIVFLDTETTSLRPDRRAWEIGLVARLEGCEEDVEHSWFVDIGDLDLGNADLISLNIGGFYQRHPVGRLNPDEFLAAAAGFGLPVTYSEGYVLDKVEQFTRGATIVGAVPNFDTEVLAARMRANGICPSWHYHLVDVETLAAGHKQLPPKWDFDQILALYGLEYAEADRHTALGDARMVRDLYDSVMNLPRAD